MKKIVVIILALMIFIGINSCSIKKPTDFDGKCKIRIFVIDTTGIVLPDSISGLAPVVDAKVQLYSQEYDLKYTSITDDNGETEIENLLASNYVISVSKKIPGELLPDTTLTNKDVLLNGMYDKAVYQNQESGSDTIKLGKKLLSKIVINEIYYCGSTSTNGNYKYDQFVELYNASDSVQFLDGLIIARASMLTAYKHQYAEAIYVYRFPGTGKDFPIVPDEHIVVAQDAINHINEAGADSSIDLSYSNWEFYNESDDINNPDVPNLKNINANFTNDFLMQLKYGGIFLIKVSDNRRFKYSSNGYMLFNFSDVLDAVEYARDAEIGKFLDNRLDAGVAGIGLQKYSGKSIERENPIDNSAGHDTDNSSLDFKIVDPPTPGY